MHIFCAYQQTSTTVATDQPPPSSSINIHISTASMPMPHVSSSLSSSALTTTTTTQAMPGGRHPPFRREPPQQAPQSTAISAAAPLPLYGGGAVKLRNRPNEAREDATRGDRRRTWSPTTCADAIDAVDALAGPVRFGQGVLRSYGSQMLVEDVDRTAPPRIAPMSGMLCEVRLHIFMV